MAEYPKFSDFATDDKKLDGEKLKLKDILNQEIIVLNYAIHRSKFKDENYLTIQFECEGDRKVVLCDLIASHTKQLGVHNPLEELLRKTTW